MGAINVRFVTVKGTQYIRAEDVADVIETIGASEDTDVRKRLEMVAYNIRHPTAQVPDQGIGGNQ